MKKLSHEILQSTEKPARYTGGEWNAARGEEKPCSFALSLPDVYEVGMSNLGLRILYEVLRGRNDTNVERVYAPWTDLEKKMREENIPLFSLESNRPLKEFDLWGFSLQYEMIYSNVLNMLDLADVSLFAAERGDDEPFVVGGGPCVYNAEPIAEFFDFFVVGEGEEAIGEIAAEFVKWKRDGKKGGRREFLRRLLTLEGIYVPSFYEPHYDADGRFSELAPLASDAKSVINKRVVRDIDGAIFVRRQIVPYMDIVHNRVMLELFRGCSRGCRFCQAGMCYRPVRERSREKLRELARALIDATGYDEMSLTSLSSADYSCLKELIDDMTQDFCDEKVSFSLPSLRIDSFSIDLAHRLQKMRKSGLTFAPEAGTQRLRDVINKGVTENDLLSACGAAFRYGWKAVKLYFMLGLPTETDEDVIGIAELAKKVVDLYAEIKGKRGVKVSVSVSCFVPKPYTPFQWFGQIPLAEFERRQQLLKEHIKDRAISFHYHDAKLSVVEGAMARGDRRLARVIFRAWQKGAKFDGWSDLFKNDVWHEAFAECGIDIKNYNERERGFDEALPWAVTSPAVDADFLRREWQRAVAGKLTGDCRRGKCEGCGVCQNLKVRVVDYAADAADAKKIIATVGDDDEKNAAQIFWYRAEVRKGEELRYLSHLDYAAVFERAILRAKLPASYTEGFSPRVRIAFASALAVGVATEAEYMDFALKEAMSRSEVFARFGKELPKGAELKRLRPITGRHNSLMAAANLACYEATISYDGAFDAAKKSVADFNAAEKIIVTRITPKKTRQKDLKAYLAKPLAVSAAKNALKLELALKINESGSVKPAEIVAVLAERFALDANPNQAMINRTAILADGKSLFDID